MRFAIAIPTAADSWRLVRRAEELGFSRAWFYDTQMLSADPFVAMAAAAMKTTRIRLGTGVLIPELGLINTKDPVGLYVAAAGPRARRLTAQLGAGWINTTADVPSAAATLDEMRREWSAAGHERDALDAIVLTGGVVLEEGEPADSPRAIAQAGPRAAMLLHRVADAALLGWPAIAAIPPSLADIVASYVELARQFRPQGAPYLENHRGHLMFVKPEE